MGMVTATGQHANLTDQVMHTSIHVIPMRAQGPLLASSYIAWLHVRSQLKCHDKLHLAALNIQVTSL